MTLTGFFIWLLVLSVYGLVFCGEGLNKSGLIFVLIISVTGIAMFKDSDSYIYNAQQIIKEAMPSAQQRAKRKAKRNAELWKPESVKERLPEADRVHIERVEAERKAEQKAKFEEQAKVDDPSYEVKNTPADTIPALRRYNGDGRSTGNEWADRYIAEARKIIQQHIDEGDQHFIMANDYALVAAARDFSHTYLITSLPGGGYKIRYDKQGNPIKLNGKTPEEVIKEKGVRMPEGVEVIEAAPKAEAPKPEVKPEEKAPEDEFTRSPEEQDAVDWENTRQTIQNQIDASKGKQTFTPTSSAPPPIGPAKPREFTRDEKLDYYRKELASAEAGLAKAKAEADMGRGNDLALQDYEERVARNKERIAELESATDASTPPPEQAAKDEFWDMADPGGKSPLRYFDQKPEAKFPLGERDTFKPESEAPPVESENIFDQIHEAPFQSELPEFIPGNNKTLKDWFDEQLRQNSIRSNTAEAFKSTGSKPKFSTDPSKDLGTPVNIRKSRTNELAEAVRNAKTKEEFDSILKELESIGYGHSPEITLKDSFNPVEALKRQLFGAKGLDINGTMPSTRFLSTTKAVRENYYRAIEQYKNELAAIKDLGTTADVEKALASAREHLSDAQETYQRELKALKQKPENADMADRFDAAASITPNETATGFRDILRNFDSAKIGENGEITIPIKPEQIASLYDTVLNNTTNRKQLQLPKGTTLEFNAEGKPVLKINFGTELPISDPAHLLHNYEGIFEGSGFVERQAKALRQLEIEKRVAELRGDSEKQAEIQDKIESLKKADTWNADQKAFNALNNEFFNQPADNIRNTQRFSNGEFGYAMTPEQAASLGRYFTPEELGAKGWRISSEGGPFNPAAITQQKFISPSVINENGLPVTSGSPGFVNNPKLRRDANGDLFIREDSTVHPEQMLGSNGEAGVLDSAPIDGWYKLNNKDARIGIRIKAHNPAGKAKKVFDYTLKPGWQFTKGVAGTTAKAVVEHPLAYIGGGVATAATINGASNFMEEVQEEADKRTNKYIADCAAAGKPVKKEDEANINAFYTQQVTEEEALSFNGAANYIVENVREGIDTAKRSITNTGREAVGLKPIPQEKKKKLVPPLQVKSPAGTRSVKSKSKAEKPIVSDPTTAATGFLGKPGDGKLSTTEGWISKPFGKDFAETPYSHSLTGAGVGAGIGGTLGALRYLLEDTSSLSEEEKKRRSLAKMILSNAGVGAGLGGVAGGIADVRRSMNG